METNKAQTKLRVITHEEANPCPMWTDNFKSSINSLIVAGGIEEYYETFKRPCFGFDEIYKKNAFYKFSSKAIESLKPFIPYCLHPVYEWNLDDNGEAYGDPFFNNHIWLNRFYKPLGCANGKLYRYEKYKYFHICSESNELKEISKILSIFEGHGCDPVYECHRKLETKKQVKDLIDKLVKIMNIFSVDENKYERFCC